MRAAAEVLRGMSLPFDEKNRHLTIGPGGYAFRLDFDLAKLIVERLTGQGLSVVENSEPEVYTNHRGYIALGEHTGETFDGHFDGWPWQAWSGPHIAYGATEDQAIKHLALKKIDDESHP